MKLSPLALAAALAAVWTLPLAARAHDGEDHDDEKVEVRVLHDDHEGSERPGERIERRIEVHGEGRGMGGPGMGGPGHDPEMKAKMEKVRELEKKTRELAHDARHGTDAEKASAKTEIRKALGELFDAKLDLDSAMLVKMEKHATELRARIAKKKSTRDQAIESRLTRMTGEGDDWD